MQKGSAVIALLKIPTSAICVLRKRNHNCVISNTKLSGEEMYYKKDFDFKQWLKKCCVFYVNKEIADDKGVCERGTLIKIHFVSQMTFGNVEVSFAVLKNDKELSEVATGTITVSKSQLLSDDYFIPCYDIKDIDKKLESCKEKVIIFNKITLAFALLYLLCFFSSSSNELAKAMAPYMSGFEMLSAALCVIFFAILLCSRHKRKLYLDEIKAEIMR